MVAVRAQGGNMGPDVDEEVWKSSFFQGRDKMEVHIHSTYLVGNSKGHWSD